MKNFNLLSPPLLSRINQRIQIEKIYIEIIKKHIFFIQNVSFSDHKRKNILKI